MLLCWLLPYFFLLYGKYTFRIPIGWKRSWGHPRRNGKRQIKVLRQLKKIEADIYRLLTVFTYTVSYSFYSLFWSRHLLITHSLSSSACSTSPPMFYVTSPNLQFPLQSPTSLSADWGTVIMWWTIFCAFHLQIYYLFSHTSPTLKICPWHSIPSVKHFLGVLASKI